jgi:flagellar biosynthesis component FlhA
MFFYVMGGGAFLLFVASDFANKAKFDYLFVAMLLLGIGWLCRRNKESTPSAERFSWVRRKNEEAKKKREAKEAAKKK